MPTYDYKCKICGHEFDVRKGIFNADRQENCPDCGGAAIRKWSAVAVQGSTSCGSAARNPSPRRYS